jgi:thymidylate synthase (FAD)
MKVIKQSVKPLVMLPEHMVMSNFAHILNVPYKQSSYDTVKTARVIKQCVRRGHLSVLEHASVTLKCVTNIETYKDFTRHRHCAFTIESTSFTLYNDELVVILDPGQLTDYVKKPLRVAEAAYKALCEGEAKGPKVARDLLPQCTAATMIMTTNFRAWRWIISLRGDPNDNPLTNELRDKIWAALYTHYPFFFPIQGDDENPMTIYDAWGPGNKAKLSSKTLDSLRVTDPELAAKLLVQEALED